MLYIGLVSLALDNSLLSPVTHLSSADYVSGSMPAVSYTIQDARPHSLSRTKLLSTWITSCEFGVLYVADGDGREINPPESRASALNYFFIKNQIIPASYTGQVIVRKFSIFVNGKAYQKSESVKAALGGGALAPMIAGGKAKGEKCPQEKMRGGWYNIEEINNNYSPIVAEIEVSIDGATFSSRNVTSPNRELIDNLWLSPISDRDRNDFITAMNGALEQLGKKISEHFAQPITR